MLSKVPINKVSACGAKLFSTSSTARLDYESCIKSLGTPKMFEDKFLEMNSKDFGPDGRVFKGSMEVIKGQVSKELQMTKLDPKTLDQEARDEVHTATADDDHLSTLTKASNGQISAPIIGGLFTGALLSIYVFHKNRQGRGL